jgi:alpha-L-fucosidase
MPAWGRYTVKGNRVYAHVFDWPADGKLTVEGIDGIQKAWLLANDTRIPISVGENLEQQNLQLPLERPDRIATVIVLESN